MIGQHFTFFFTEVPGPNRPTLTSSKSCFGSIWWEWLLRFGCTCKKWWPKFFHKCILCVEQMGSRVQAYKVWWVGWWGGFENLLMLVVHSTQLNSTQLNSLKEWNWQQASNVKKEKAALFILRALKLYEQYWDLSELNGVGRLCFLVL
jgi:hypothetical protein